MSNLTMSPVVTVPNSQGAGKILTTGANSGASVQDSDFSKKLNKAMNSSSGTNRKKLSYSKEKNIPVFNNQANSSQDSRPAPKGIQPLKPLPSKWSNSINKQQPDLKPDNQTGDKKSALSKDDPKPITDSDENKNKRDGNDQVDMTGSPLIAAASVEPIVVNQGEQPDNKFIEQQSGIDAMIALDKQTANASISSADTGVIGGVAESTANPTDMIHDLNGGTAFLKQLMSADDSKILSPASAGTAMEPSLLQNHAQNGAGASGDNFLAQQTSGVSPAQSQNFISQQVPIAENIKSNGTSEPVAEGQDNTKTPDTSDGKIQAPFSALKTDDGSPVLPSSKASGGAMQNLNSDASQPDSNEKGIKLGDSLASGRIVSKGGKGQSLNLPLIQTQLSVNNQSDKTRTDNSAAFSVEQPHMANVSAKFDALAGPSEPVNKDDVFAQIVEKAKVSLDHGNGEMEVNLKPDHLGKLHLKVSVENQLVTAKFVAESQQVKEIIETNLNQLRRNLQDNGIQVDQLMVSVGQHNNEGAFQNASHNSGGFTGQPDNTPTGNQEISFKSKENPVQPRRSGVETAIDLIA